MAAMRRGRRTQLGCRKNGGGDWRPLLGLPESIRVLGQLLRISKMFGRHWLTQRRREPLKVESQEELVGGLIRPQLRQHGVHHVCQPLVTQLHGGQELREQGGVRWSIGLPEDQHEAAGGRTWQRRREADCPESLA